MAAGRAREQGSLSVEHLGLVLGIACAGFGGMAAVGGAMDRAVRLDAGGRATVVAAPLSAQAGAISALADEAALLRRAQEAAASAGEAHVWTDYARRPINPMADDGNCVACAHALDSTLGGNAASARAVFADAFRDGIEGIVDLLARDSKARDRAVQALLGKFALLRELKPALADTVDELSVHIRALGKEGTNLADADPDLLKELAVAHAIPSADPASIARAFGRAMDDWADYPSLLELDHAVSAWPDGAKGVVSARMESGSSHVFNVARVDGRTYFLDGQTGISLTRAAFPKGKAMLLRTDDIPAHARELEHTLPPASHEFTGLEGEVPVDYFANPEFVNPRGRGAVTFVDEDYRGKGQKCARGVNCAKVVSATDHMLGGTGPQQALPFFGRIAGADRLDSQLLDGILRAIGVDSASAYVLVGSRGGSQGARRLVRSFGDGSKGVLRIERKSGSAHFVNFVNVDGALVVIDNQKRRTARAMATDLDDATRITVIRTADMPAAMRGDLAGWLATKPDHALVVDGAAK
jgi:hypothetical protein